MSVRVLSAGVAVALTSMGALAIADGGGAARGSAPPSTMTFSAHSTGVKVIDQPPRGPSPGDEVLAHGRLLDTSGKAIGTFELVSQLVSGGSRGGIEQTAQTVFLPGGQLVALGGHPTTERFTLPVVGGSGTYTGARGTLSIAPGHGQNTKLVIHLEGS